MSIYRGDTSKVITINSLNRIPSSFSSTNFSISVNNLPRLNYNRVVLNQISIPRSWYDIGNSYNTFLLSEGTSSILITITPGAYTLVSFPTVLISLLNTNSPNGFKYTISYPNSTNQANSNKWTFSCNATEDQIPSFTFGDYQGNEQLNGLYLQFGFNQNSTNTFSKDGSSYSLASANSVSMSYINRLYLISNICATSLNSMLQELLVVGQYPSLSYCYFENQNKDTNSRVFTEPTANFWNFQLQDEYGNIVDLNGLDFNFTLTLYVKDDTSDLHRETLLLDNLERLVNK